jgi:hypothetical protein
VAVEDLDDRVSLLVRANERAQARSAVQQQRELTGARYYPVEVVEYERVELPGASPLLAGSIEPLPSWKAAKAWERRRREGTMRRKQHLGGDGEHPRTRNQE